MSIFAEDVRGRRSLPFRFSVSVVATIATTISNIVLPPTVSLTAEESAPRTLIVDGASLPGETVSLPSLYALSLSSVGKRHDRPIRRRSHHCYTARHNVGGIARRTR